jgi:Spy/CpxP family protein refolding chaperone
MDKSSDDADIWHYRADEPDASGGADVQHSPLLGKLARIIKVQARKLELSKTQQESIREILAGYGEQLERVSKRVRSALADTPADQRAAKVRQMAGNVRQHLQDLSRQTVKKVLAVLTPEQRESVRRLFDSPETDDRR